MWLFLVVILSIVSSPAYSLRSAFSPRPPPIYEELGCSPTLSLLFNCDFYFDPLQLADDSNFALYREAELKHGRIAMLAMAQIMASPALHALKLVNRNVSLDRLSLPSPKTAMAIVALCGIIETLILVRRDALDMPGDYGTGYFGVRDKAANEYQLIVELEHGRLAMMSFAAFVALDVATRGMPWLELWRSILSI